MSLPRFHPWIVNSNQGLHIFLNSSSYNLHAVKHVPSPSISDMSLYWRRSWNAQWSVHQKQLRLKCLCVCLVASLCGMHLCWCVCCNLCDSDIVSDFKCGVLDTIFFLFLPLCFSLSVCVCCRRGVLLLAFSDPSVSVLYCCSPCCSRWTCFLIRLLMRLCCSFCGSLKGGPTI